MENMHNSKDDNEPSGKIRNLLFLAPYTPGYNGKFTSLNEIPWVDFRSIQDGLQFYQKYLCPFILSSSLLIMIGACVKPVSSVFYTVGALFSDSEATYKHMLRALSGADNLYRSMENLEESKRQFDLLGKMHKFGATRKMELYRNSRKITDCTKEPWKTDIVNAVKKDMEAVRSSYPPDAEIEEQLKQILVWNPPVNISQFDMVFTALASFTAMWIRPEMFGIKNREKEMAGIVHLWALFSKQLGVEDRFNICLEPLNSENIDKFVYASIGAALKSIDETVVTCQYACARGFCRRFWFLTYTGMLYYGIKIIYGENYHGKHLWKVMNWRDKFCAKGLGTLFWTMANIPGCLYIANILARKVMTYLIKRKPPSRTRCSAENSAFA